jgi:cytochrome b6-f complex iron-sulfur subunit
LERSREPEDSPGHEDARADSTSTRRRFLTWLSQAFLGLWGLSAAAAVASYLRAPERGRGAAERTVSVGLLEDLQVGEGRLVRHGTQPFYVVRMDATRVIALSAVCTHVRCILGYDRERRGFVCPCHDGRFDLAGNVLSGPPPRALPTYAVSVRAGEVFVHL